MNRRNFLWTVGGALLAGPALALPNDGEVEVRRGTKRRLLDFDNPRDYVSVGSDPRRIPISGWKDAMDYVQDPAFRHDVLNRIALVFDEPFRPTYKKMVVEDALFPLIELANEHRYMTGACPVCPGGVCQQRDMLGQLIKYKPIAHGTKYLAVTHGNGRSGSGVQRNLVFKARPAGQYKCYRFYLPNIPMREERDRTGKRVVVYGSTHFDLIARCGNAALGEFFLEWVEYQPPMVEVPPPPIEEKPEIPEKPYVERPEQRPIINKPKAVARAQAQSNATGGNVVINNYPAPMMYAYVPGEQSRLHAWNYRAGGVAFSFQPFAKAVAKQSQSQQQQQQQQQELLNAINNINNNILTAIQELNNQNLIEVPISIATA